MKIRYNRLKAQTVPPNNPIAVQHLLRLIRLIRYGLQKDQLWATNYKGPLRVIQAYVEFVLDRIDRLSAGPKLDRNPGPMETQITTKNIYHYEISQAINSVRFYIGTPPNPVPRPITKKNRQTLLSAFKTFEQQLVEVMTQGATEAQVHVQSMVQVANEAAAKAQEAAAKAVALLQSMLPALLQALEEPLAQAAKQAVTQWESQFKSTQQNWTEKK